MRIQKRLTLTIAVIGLSSVLMALLYIPADTLTNSATPLSYQKHDVKNSEDYSKLVPNNSVDPISDINSASGNTPMKMPFSGLGHYQVIPQAMMDNLIQKAYAAGTIKHFTLVASEGLTTLPETDSMVVFTFNGTYPAPTLRVTQGDVVQVTVINPASNGFVHSIDFHGSQLSAVPNFGAISPGSSATLTFVAVNPGVWAYHCEGNNVFGLWEHPMKGMAGMMIVDPTGGYTSFVTNKIQNFSTGSLGGLTFTTGNTVYAPKTIPPIAREFQLVYGEWYLTSNPTVGGSEAIQDFDQQKMFNEIPTYAHENGIPFGYTAPLFTLPPWTTKHLSDVMLKENLLPGNVDPPLSALVTPDANNHTAATALNVIAGDHVRFFIQNTGDKEVAWHIVGAQLDRVSIGNNPMAKAVQTWSIPAYGDATIDVVFSQPGVYAAVNHDYSLFFKGQAAIIVVWPTGTQISNPSNAVPPTSALPNTSIPQIKCLYGIGPDKVPSTDDNTFVSRCGPL